MKQSDTVGGLILIPLTLSALFCHLQSEICRAERKVCLFGFVLFFRFCFSASLPCLSLFWGFVLLLLFCFVFFFWCSLFHLTSDLARFGAQFRSCVTVHPPPTPPHRKTYSHSHISPN